MASCSFDIVSEEIPQSAKNHCLRFPWFGTLKNDAFLQPLRSAEPESRNEHPPGNVSFARTLNTKATMPDFYSLGSSLNGHQGFYHGGSLSTPMDQTMGTLARAYTKTDSYTKYLNVNFSKSFPTPGALLCRVWLRRIEGPKLWVYGRIEDGQENVYVTAESMWIVVGPKL